MGSNNCYISIRYLLYGSKTYLCDLTKIVMQTFQAIIIAIIEGLTEYLPVSSTAHMIFASSFFNIQNDDFVKLFQVSIQLGAIMAVVVLYWKKFFDFSKINFYIKLACAVVPALVLGKLFDDYIDAILGNPIPIAIMLIVGGFVLLFVDNYFKNPIITKEEDIDIKKAVKIGFWQCLAMMPGTSRSAASIIGGMQQGLSREVAAEFSFFLAVPTMLAVTCYSVFLKTYEASNMKGYELILKSSDHIMMFILGNIVAFIVAILAIKFFIGIIKQYGFRPWGWYRIIMGIVLLVYFIGK
jgi:undecaprenyl-diphosphatase